VRTMSRGYVQKTEVMPAAPPHTKRLTELRSAPGDGSKNYSIALVEKQGLKVLHGRISL
jgi:hypothetical protein